MSVPHTLASLWKPTIPLSGTSRIVNRGFVGSCTKCFHVLLQLAWESRFRLPVVYVILSFLFDIQMRVEINFYRERRLVLTENERDELENVDDVVNDGDDEDHDDDDDDDDGDDLNEINDEFDNDFLDLEDMYGPHDTPPEFESSI